MQPFLVGPFTPMLFVHSGKNTLINACDADGFTPLHHAAKQGNVKVVKFLLHHGADVGAITKGDGLGALHLACQYNHKDHGADVTKANDREGHSSASCCSLETSVHLSRSCCWYGAQYSATNKDHKIPLSLPRPCAN
eukprot:Em0631g1a